MKPETWPWFNGKYKAHCETADQHRACLRLSRVERGGVYTMPNGPREHDVILPCSKYNDVSKILGLPARKRLRLRKSQTTATVAQ